MGNPAKAQLARAVRSPEEAFNLMKGKFFVVETKFDGRPATSLASHPSSALFCHAALLQAANQSVHGVAAALSSRRSSSSQAAEVFRTDTFKRMMEWEVLELLSTQAKETLLGVTNTGSGHL